MARAAQKSNARRIVRLGVLETGFYVFVLPDSEAARDATETAFTSDLSP
jgi:hypothetical protein